MATFQTVIHGCDVFVVYDHLDQSIDGCVSAQESKNKFDEVKAAIKDASLPWPAPMRTNMTLKTPEGMVVGGVVTFHFINVITEEKSAM